MTRRTNILIWLIVACLAIGVIISEKIKVSNRIQEPNYTTGVITNKGKRAKGEKYVAYRFVVNSVEYYGTVNIRYCNKCKGDDCCEIGAKVKVRYEKSNPANNDLIN